MEEIIYNKIYARANAKGIVTRIFSEAFEQPLNTDVCIEANNTERHGAQKYLVVDENGFYNYEIKDGVFVTRDTTKDFNIEQSKNEILKKKEYLSQTDYVVTKISEAIAEGNIELQNHLLTEYADVLQQRKIAREEINVLEMNL